MKMKFYIFSPCFYMLLSVLAGETASLIFGYAPKLAYSVFSAAVPMLVYFNCGGEKISFKSECITCKIFITALFLWAGGNLLNSVINIGFERFGILPPEQLETGGNTYAAVMDLICVCVAAPICEELVYRGIILKSSYVYGEETAVFISAFLFALAHGSVTLFAMPFIYGIVCGNIAVKTGSILPGIVIHCICNMLSYAAVKTDFSITVYVTVLLGIVYTVYLAVIFVKNIKTVKKAISGFLCSIDLWWIPVFIKTVLNNIT